MRHYANPSIPPSSSVVGDREHLMLGKSRLHIHRFLLTHHLDSDLLARLIRTENARRMRSAGGLAPVNGQNHVAILQLEVLWRPHDEHTLFRAEVTTELWSQRRQLHFTQRTANEDRTKWSISIAHPRR